MNEQFGGDLGACFHGAHFSINGVKNKLRGVWSVQACAELCQAAVDMEWKQWDTEYGWEMKLQPAQLWGAKFYFLPALLRCPTSYCGETFLKYLILTMFFRGNLPFCLSRLLSTISHTANSQIPGVRLLFSHQAVDNQGHQNS